MKLIQSSVFRALCAISVGVLLIEYREQTATWLTVAIGALFFLSGVISLATYYSARKLALGTENNETEGNSEATTKPSLPLAGIGSLVLGHQPVRWPRHGTPHRSGGMVILGDALRDSAG